MRQEFLYSNLIRSLKSEDIETYEITDRLYDQTIDFGAHPNPKGILASMRQQDRPEAIKYDLDYLNPTGIAFQLTLKMTAQIGVCNLCILRNVFKERYDLLLLSDRLTKLQEGL